MNLIHHLLTGPHHPEREFILNQATYADIYAMAAYLFHELAEQKIVCLYTENRAMVAAAVLSAMAGGPQLMLPYALNPRVLGEIRNLVPYQTLVTDEKTVAAKGFRPCIPQTGKIPWPVSDFSHAPHPDTPILHLFTGGSTGTPAVWPKTTRNLISETFNIVSTYGFCKTDRVMATTFPLHIYGLLYAVLAPFAAGAGTISGSPSFPAEIEAAITTHNASILVSVPAHYRALRHHPCPPFPLRLAFSSAGMLDEKDAAAFGAAHHLGINEVYGSTETGGVANRNRFSGETAFTAFKPVTVRLADEHIQVKSGFLSPGLPLTGDGFYQMGDRASFSAPNRFLLMGRSDSIVKVGGKRVDLTAIRTLLLEYPDVTDAWVTSLAVGHSRENQIVAIVEGRAHPNKLDIMLTKALEPYARPRQIQVVDKIPLTSAGKYDRKQIESYFRKGE